jgi:hypothetical protein
MIPEKIEDSPLVIFNPNEEVMYPLRGNLQDLSQKKGVEVDVKGWGDVMEGASRRKYLESSRLPSSLPPIIVLSFTVTSTLCIRPSLVSLSGLFYLPRHPLF